MDNKEFDAMCNKAGIKKEMLCDTVFTRQFKEKELTPEQESHIGDDVYHEKKIIEEDIAKDKKLKECYDWWGNLTEEEQFKIMMDYYPTEVKEDTDIDKMFGDMPSDKQLWIYFRVKEPIKVTGKIPINPARFDQILKGIGRRKLGKTIIKVKGGL